MRFKFYEPVMGTDITVIVGRENVKGISEEYLLDHQGSIFRIEKTENGKTWIEYELYMEDEGDFYTLSHECIHLTGHLFSDRQIPITKDNDEIFAYYHTFLLKKIWRKVHYSKKKEKK